MSNDQLKVECNVPVGAKQLFALLADPARHVEFDGSGLMRGLADGGRLNAVGDVFVMDMSIDILGGPYQVRNTLIAFEEGAQIGWGVQLHPLDGYTDKIGTMKAQGHFFRWDLEPAEDGTHVTLVYDWSGVQDPQYREMFPFLKEDQLLDSIDRLAKAAR
ncbi:MAG: polyketide cyclase [Sporichthyaceae bacterium]